MTVQSGLRQLVRGAVFDFLQEIFDIESFVVEIRDALYSLATEAGQTETPSTVSAWLWVVMKIMNVSHVLRSRRSSMLLRFLMNSIARGDGWFNSTRPVSRGMVTSAHFCELRIQQ